MPRIPQYEMPNRPPDLICGIVEIWVLGRQFPDAADYWDANWVHAVARCSDKGACVTVCGPIIHLGEISQWRSLLAAMDEKLAGDAPLPTIEPNLHITLSCDHMGHIQAVCRITPDQLAQSHEYRFMIDQTHLKGLIGCCDKILRDYPVIDPQQKEWSSTIPA